MNEYLKNRESIIFEYNLNEGNFSVTLLKDAPLIEIIKAFINKKKPKFLVESKIPEYYRFLVCELYIRTNENF